jgi:hypothetical protein
MLADPAQHGALDDDDAAPHPHSTLAVTTFSAAGARLHVCAVGQADAATETSAAGAEVLARVASGFTRLLAQ